MKPTIGILLTNLGTPDAPRAPALRRYLKQFLSDPRVIELPRWKWLPILYLFVLTSRPRKSAALYKKIWTSLGSPLLLTTFKQALLLKAALEQRIENKIQIEVGMRYGNPSIDSALEKLRAAGACKLFVLPLYPQYSAATTGSTFDEVACVLRKWRAIPEFRMLTEFYDEPGYIHALANRASRRMAAVKGQGQRGKLLFSFHGIPERYSQAGDPYYAQCLKTGQLMAQALNLRTEHYIVSFQSRFGREEWLKPYTDQVVTELGQSGVELLEVMCPGFTTDCLETLEEIDEQNRELFRKAGGKEFHYIPCLNDSAEFINFLAELLLKNMTGWVELKAGAVGAADTNAAFAR